MNVGIVIGVMTVVIALILNYINLFRFNDLSDGTKYGQPVKHFLITYYVSWIFACIPFVSIFIEIIWFAMQIDMNYKCTSILFKRV